MTALLRITGFITLLLITNVALAQVEEEAEEEYVYETIERAPEFPGGEQEFYDYISEEIKYPAKAKELGQEGSVYVQFIIEKDGSVTNVIVIRGVSTSIDEEAIRVISQMPKWTPGYQDGEPVRVQYVIPIHFYLGSGDAEERKWWQFWK